MKSILFLMVSFLTATVFADSATLSKLQASSKGLKNYHCSFIIGNGTNSEQQLSGYNVFADSAEDAVQFYINAAIPAGKNKYYMFGFPQREESIIKDIICNLDHG